MIPFLLVAVGGSIGAIMRYGLSLFISQRWDTFFPLGTLIVNVSGCLAIAFLTVKGLESTALSPTWRLFLIVGLGGAFTTFSSFSVETLLLLNDGLYYYALLNILSNVGIGLLAAVLGFTLGKIL